VLIAQETLKSCTRHTIALVDVYNEGMKYFTPINVASLNRTVWLNPHTFEHTADNLTKMAQGKAPLGVDNKPVTLHHIGRKHSAPLVTLTDSFHRKANPQIHNLASREPVQRKKFKREKQKIWQGVHEWLSAF